MKIPFERTIAAAYRFAFTNILSVIGVGWFPFLLFAALAGGLGYLLLPTIHDLWLQDQKTFDAAKVFTHVIPLVGAAILLVAALFVVQAMVNVGLTRKALGQHPRPVLIFFSLGSQVWQLIGAYILMSLLILGGVLLAALAIGAVAMAAAQVSQPAAGVVTGILTFFAILAYFYSVVRLSFFIPAVIVAENHIGLRRAWHLGGGNFWRIIGILLIVGIPIGLADSTIVSTLMQMAMLPGQYMPQGPMTDAEGHKVFADLLDAARRIGPYYALVQVLYFVLLSGLNMGAVANAYLAVTGAPDTKAAA